MAVILDENQRTALKEMHNGCILNGAVGTGKSRTALAYYHCIIGGGRIRPHFELMQHPVDLYIITTAATRDKMDWEKEMIPFLLYNNRSNKQPEEAVSSDKKPYKTTVTIDSWNNIKKYVGVSGAFFIFDESKVKGNGEWVKAFLKITKVNQWVLLSATPGDTYEDYIPVFIANGFFKNRTEFYENHAQRRWNGKYYQTVRYFGTRRLDRLLNSLLVDIPLEKSTDPQHIDIFCNWDRGKYRDIMRNRWDPWKQEPIDNATNLCGAFRKLVNTDPSRMNAVLEILDEHPKAIIFYNFDYELEMLKSVLSECGYSVAEWNGHKHEPIPLKSDKWVYLCQYNASEGWNCIHTDTMIFFSQNYSYSMMVQAAGRIDRRNTPFITLYYYHLRSKAPIDLAITKALNAKETFNEGRYFNKLFEKERSGS